MNVIIVILIGYPLTNCQIFLSYHQKAVDDAKLNNSEFEDVVIDEVGDVDDKISLSQFCDSETQTDCTCLSENILSSSSTADQATQVGEFPSRPYQCYEVRKRSEIRTELIDKIRDLLDGYVHGDSLALSCARYCPVQKMVEYLKEKETSEHQINCFAP